LVNSRVINAQTGEVDSKALAVWLRKNNVVLNKYGITDSFSNLKSVQSTLDALKTEQNAFGKSVAGKILGSDPQVALKTALSGNNTGIKMLQLVDQLGGDKDALIGLQNAFKDMMIREAETTASDISGDKILSPASIVKSMKKYEPAMDVLYRDSPEKLQALRNTQQAMDIQSRAVKSPLGGGSDTAEKLQDMSRFVRWLPMGSKLADIGHFLAIKWGNLSASQVNSLTARALYDPDLAMILRQFGKRTLSPESFDQRFTDYLGSIGIYEAKDVAGSITNRNKPGRNK
jgi:hypothetical protein